MPVLKTLRYLVDHPLNRKNKVDAIVKFFRWQIGSRLIVGDVVCNWINNSKFIARAGEEGITGNIYCGLHEFVDMAFLLHSLRDDDLFVDVGANVGSYTILACAVVGSRVYCVEPVPSTFDKLLCNIRINGVEDCVVASNIALGNMKDEIHLSSDENCANHVLAEGERSNQSVAVKVSTLDEELTQVPFMIKIDVEGYEYPALQGAQNLLKVDDLCSVIMELNGSGERYGFDEREIISMMLDLGFNTYSYEPFSRILTSLGGKNSSNGNTIFIRDLDRVVARISNAPKIEVNGVSI